MRKSIFDIASASINISNEVDRIVSMSAKEKSTYSPPYDLTLFEFVDSVVLETGVIEVIL